MSKKKEEYIIGPGNKAIGYMYIYMYMYPHVVTCTLAGEIVKEQGYMTFSRLSLSGFTNYPLIRPPITSTTLWVGVYRRL